MAEYDNVGTQLLKKAKGGEQEILSPKEALAQQSVNYAKAFRRNEALKEVYKSIKSDVKVLYDLGEIVDIDQANMVIKDAIGYDEKLKTYTATIFEDGKAKVFKISKDIYDAFTENETIKAFEDTIDKLVIGKVLKGASNTFKSLTTGKNLLYALKNMTRDINDAPINSTTNFANYMKDWGYAYEQIVTDGKYWQEFVNAGGSSNTFYDYNKGLIKTEFKSLPRKAVDFLNKQTIGRVEDINQVVELAPRLAEYIATRQRGGGIDEALYNSAEVTTNFKRGGEIAKLVDKYGVPYLNSSIQGLSKVYRNISEAKGFKGYSRLIISAGLCGVLPSVLNHLIYEDDEEYEELPDYIKDGYYLIKVDNIPDGMQDLLGKYTENNFIRIPKGRISAVLGGTAVRMHKTIAKEGEDVWNNYLSDVVLNNIGINNPIKNNLFSGMVQAMDNEAWYGGTIYSETKYDGKLPVEITDEKTDKFSNWVAETVYDLAVTLGGEEKYKELVKENAFFKIMATPKLLNYAIDQYSGIAGDMILPMLTPYAENNAFIDQFTTSSTLKSTSVSKFYDIIDNCYQNSEHATDSDKLTYNYLLGVSKDVSDLYKEKSKIQNNSELNNREKQKQTYEIQEQINSKMKEAVESVEGLKIKENSAVFNNSQYYKNDEGEWKEITEKQLVKELDSETYADYKNKTATATDKKRAEKDNPDAQLSDKEKIEILKESKYSQKETQLIYENYINKEDDVYKSLKLINKGNNRIDDYLDYKTADLSSDKKDDGTKNGKTIRGSAEDKFIKYMKASEFSNAEKLYLYATKYKLDSTERRDLQNYIKGLGLTKTEQEEIYKSLSSTNVVEMKDGTIKWKN